MASQAIRPQGLCSVEDPICPKCAHVVHGRLTARPGGVLVTCWNRRKVKGGRDRSQPGARERCNQKVLLLPVGAGMVQVVALDRQEFDAIVADHDRPLRDQLKDLGILIGKGAA